MDTPFGKIVIAAAGAATMLLSSPAAARPTSIRGLAAQEVRMAAIAYRIAAANAHACPAGEVMTGMILHDLTRYNRQVRAAVSRAFSMTGGVGVLGVVPGSVAAEAGLRVDDEIVAVGRFGVEDSTAGSRPQSSRRMEQFHAHMNAAMTLGRTELIVRRGGSLLRMPLRAQKACGGRLALSASSTLNAWSDGKNIVITRAMAGLAQSDHEIAFVIAHEMAHNILGHASEGGGSRGIFGFSKIKRGEIEADSYAVRLMANANYEPAGGIAFLENARRRLWWSIPLDHPGFGRRIEIVAAAMRSAPRSATRLPSMIAGTAPTTATSSQVAYRIAEKISAAALGYNPPQQAFASTAGIRRFTEWCGC